MTDGLVGDGVRAGGEIEGLEGDPAGIVAALEDLENRREIVIGLTAMPAVEFVDVDVTNEIVVAIDEHGVRLDFVYCVMRVEHGADGWAVDFFYQRDGFFEGLDYVGLAYGQALR